MEGFSLGLTLKSGNSCHRANLMGKGSLERVPEQAVEMSTNIQAGCGLSLCVLANTYSMSGRSQRLVFMVTYYLAVRLSDRKYRELNLS